MAARALHRPLGRCIGLRGREEDFAVSSKRVSMLGGYKVGIDASGSIVDAGGPLRAATKRGRHVHRRGTRESVFRSYPAPRILHV
eukprot:SAG22_NODE_13704_length_397_cov_0.963087_2_plen_84_part_01